MNRIKYTNDFHILKNQLGTTTMPVSETLILLHIFPEVRVLPQADYEMHLIHI